jgi:TonB family protein
VPAEPTTLLIGVSNEGKVLYSLVQHSSGDPALDELAIEHLRNVTFAAAPAPVAWGFATFSWGGDAYAPASKSP